MRYACVTVELIQQCKGTFTPVSNLLQSVQCSIATKRKGVFTKDDVSEFSSHTQGCLLTATVVSSINILLEVFVILHIAEFLICKGFICGIFHFHFY